MDEEKKEGLIRLLPKLIALIRKTVKLSRDGLNKDERKELGQDLIDLGLAILEQLDD